jgi:hypothetical protein
VLGKPIEVSQAESHKFFGIAYTRFPSPLQMTLQQATTGIRGIDVAMLRQVERPDRKYRRAQWGVVNHVRFRREETSSDANSSLKTRFLFFRTNASKAGLI